MKIKYYLFFFLCLFQCSLSFSQNYQWAKGIGSAGDESGTAIAVDAYGNVCITGNFSGILDFDPGPGTVNLTSAGLNDIYFAKYDGLGNLIWVKAITSTSNDLVSGIALDTAGNIYLTGRAGGSGTDFDPGPGIFNLSDFQNLFFAKYNGNGIFQWAKGLKKSGPSNCLSIYLDAGSNIYLSGYIQNADSIDFDPGIGIVNVNYVGGTDIFFAKYNWNGIYQWAKIIGSTVDESSYSIVADATGNVYSSGYYSDTTDFDAGPGSAILSPAGNSDIFITKYDGSGNYLWAKSIGSKGYDNGNSLAFDAGGNVYITGYFSDTVDFDPGSGAAMIISAGSQDVFFAKYDGSGNYLWAKNIAGTNQDFGVGIALGADGSVYLTGNYSGTADFDPGFGTANITSAGTQDMFFAKYDGNGNYIWAKSIGGSSHENVLSIATDASDGVYLTGNFSGVADFNPGAVTANLVSAGIQDIFIAKYNANPTSIQEISSQEKSIHVYPNPSEGNFIIQFTEVAQNFKDGIIEIYSVLGEKLHSEKIKDSNSTTIELNLQSGIYMLRIATEKEDVVKKIIIQ